MSISIEARGLLNDIICNPNDNNPRLIYADWLEDNNKIKEANYLRFQLANPDIVDEIQEPFWGISLIRNRRGFPEYIECTLASWVDQGPQLVRNHPITKVRLIDKQPECVIFPRLPYIRKWYWFPSSGPYPTRHVLTNSMHQWMINNECGRKNNCWDSEDAAWYALILWAKAQP